MRSSTRWILLLAALPVACSRAPEEARDLRLAGASMGTTWSARVVAPPGELDAPALSERLAALFDGLDAALSTYRADSELSRFDAAASGAWFPVSRDTLAVVDEALRVCALTGGALDPTVAPLVELWGFGPAPRRDAPPAADELAAVRALVGAGALETRADPPALRKSHAGLALDLSALAKGHAIDRAAELLEADGIERYLVELGGELRARGRNALGLPWRVAVEREPGAPPLVLRLEDAAVATSGDGRQAFVAGGRRYSHVLDPRTGEPVANGVRSVTVVAARAIAADALATALMVLGPDEAARVAEREGLAYHMRCEREGETVELRSPAFDELVLAEEDLQ